MALVIWNWSWTHYEAAPCRNMLARLPGDVTLLADFERGGLRRTTEGAVKVDEYSLGYAGPSEDFVQVKACCDRLGIPVMAKLQIGTTHELGTVPNLPAIGNLYEKARKMREMGIVDFMGCWNFGNFRSANSAAFLYFLDIFRRRRP